MSYEDREDYQELHGVGLTWLEWVGAFAIATIAMAVMMTIAFVIG